MFLFPISQGESHRDRRLRLNLLSPPNCTESRGHPVSSGHRTWLSGLAAPGHRQALFCKTPSAGYTKVRIQASCPEGTQARGKVNNASLHVTGRKEGDPAREEVPLCWT